MESSVSCDVAALLREYAERYETADFIVGDPSWFMHQVSSDADREVMAFLAAGLSYGSRAQFLPKIQSLLDSAEGQPDAWVRDGAYRDCFFEGDTACFYRLYTRGDMFCFLELLRALLGRYGSLGGYLRDVLVADGALPSRLRAAGPSACLPSRLRAASPRSPRLHHPAARTRLPTLLCRRGGRHRPLRLSRRCAAISALRPWCRKMPARPANGSVCSFAGWSATHPLWTSAYGQTS